MGNWSKQWKKFHISWYNIKNMPEDSYAKKYNDSYKKFGKEYYRKIFHMFFGEYGINWQDTWSDTSLIFEGPDNLYWIRFKTSDNYLEKPYWKFKCWKMHNDHTSCG